MKENFLIYFDKEGLLGSEHSNYSDLLKQCIHINVVSMQGTFDINHAILKQVFEHQDFIEYTKKELIKLTDALKIELKNKIMKEYPQEYYLNSKLKIENCGYIKKCYVNGYIEYCNVHKYEHQTCDHDFIHKTPLDAMKEYNTQIKYVMYQELVTSLSKKIKQYVEALLKTHYSVFDACYSDDLKNWVVEHPTAFKTRAKNKENKISFYVTNYDSPSFSDLVK